MPVKESLNLFSVEVLFLLIFSSQSHSTMVFLFQVLRREARLGWVYLRSRVKMIFSRLLFSVPDKITKKIKVEFFWSMIVKLIWASFLNHVFCSYLGISTQWCNSLYMKNWKSWHNAVLKQIQVFSLCLWIDIKS